MGMGRIHGDVLGEPAISLAAEEPHRGRVLVLGLVESGVDHHTAAHELAAHALSYLDDNAGDISTLDARKIKRTSPACLRRGIFRQPIGSLACPNVGVIDGSRSYFHQHLLGLRPRAGSIVVQFQYCRSTKLGQYGCRHHVIHRSSLPLSVGYCETGLAIEVLWSIARIEGLREHGDRGSSARYAPRSPARRIVSAAQASSLRSVRRTRPRAPQCTQTGRRRRTPRPLRPRTDG